MAEGAEPEQEKYRILSFDGGGIRGILSNVMLERLNVLLGFDPGSRAWIEQADLIAGTSVGGLTAIGLANGLTPTDLKDFFYHRGPIMFEDSLLDDIRNVGRLLGAEYSTKNRREVLEDILGDTTLGDLGKDLEEDRRANVLICAFDLQGPAGRWKAKFFHNLEPTKPDETNPDMDERAADVALYTTAAPTFFPSFGGYVDGGIVANNPAMAALAQTQDGEYRNSRHGFENIVLLSIGTGMNLNGIEGEEHDWGYVQWGRHLVTAVDDGLIGIADYQCHQLLGDQQYHRIDYDFPSGKGVEVDEYEKRDYLVEVGERYMDEELEDAKTWLELNWL